MFLSQNYRKNSSNTEKSYNLIKEIKKIKKKSKKAKVSPKLSDISNCS